MVSGIESFARKFRDYSDCYTVIGGAACAILMSETDLEFRATKDIDRITRERIIKPDTLSHYNTSGFFCLQKYRHT